MLAGTWIADVKQSIFTIERYYKESITCTMDHKEAIIGTIDRRFVNIVASVGIPENGPLVELATIGTYTRVAKCKKATFTHFTFTLHEVDDRKRRLVFVVCEEKVVGGGSMAP
jgi:hypothetical protein